MTDESTKVVTDERLQAIISEIEELIPEADPEMVAPAREVQAYCRRWMEQDAAFRARWENCCNGPGAAHKVLGGLSDMGYEILADFWQGPINSYEGR